MTDAANIPPADAPIVVAPVVVVAPAGASAPPTTTLEQDRDAVSRRLIEERAAPKTTEEEDRKTAGQRHINVMWEGTQRNIAQEVTVVALAVTAFLVVWPGVPLELRLMAYTTLSNVFFAVTSVYFTRTNHTKTGGVGSNELTR